MVLLGSWPYNHTVSLRKLHRDTGVTYIYLADEDKIVHRDDVGADYTIDDDLHVAFKEETRQYMHRYQHQLFPPDIPDDIAKVMDHDELVDELREKVQDHGALVVVNGQSSDIMECIGARWNDDLGLWVVSDTHLHTIKEAKRERYDGRVLYEPFLDTEIKVWGDTNPHVDLLQKHGGRYRPDEDAWYVPLSSFDRIAHIFS